ncbi:MAG: LmbE family protein [Dehalococcoidales bacterium]|jgi:LmbE family N-acetylglucosaminyl deacetylase|nr:LmbE family protein [Dehalococcoidales bacterium]|tara:strand:- start:121 stop:756 length:636 start_codon:yes stop_codon:yes gene_type:complete
MNDFKRILALSPHTDDAELGAGGTLARWIEEGKEVFYAAFSIAEKSVPEGLPQNILEEECKQATKSLGLKGNNLSIYKFPVRDFPKFRQEILEILVSLREELKPDLVLLPSLKDVHQDHHTIAEEGIRAFKNTSLLAYELPWNLLSFELSCLIILHPKQLDKKVKAIECYQSQKHRNYTSKEFIYGWARSRGVQINAEYAEVFEVIRWVIR